MERKEAEKGSDLADYLIKYDWRSFQAEPEPEEKESDLFPVSDGWNEVQETEWTAEDEQLYKRMITTRRKEKCNRRNIFK